MQYIYDTIGACTSTLTVCFFYRETASKVLHVLYEYILVMTFNTDISIPNISRASGQGQQGGLVSSEYHIIVQNTIQILCVREEIITMYTRSTDTVNIISNTDVARV